MNGQIGAFRNSGVSISRACGNQTIVLAVIVGTAGYQPIAKRGIEFSLSSDLQNKRGIDGARRLTLNQRTLEQSTNTQEMASAMPSYKAAGVARCQ